MFDSGNVDDRSLRDLVMVKGDEIVTTSRTIAEVFGRAHRTIRRAITNLECSAEFRQHNFVPSEYLVEMPTGHTKSVPEYTITRDGCMFLIMGLTGPQAGRYKEAFIHAFNWMAETIRQRDQLNWQIQDHTRRCERSLQDGAYHGRGLARRRHEKRNLADEERRLKSDIQLNLFFIQKK